ncbi:DUF1232 domain-containing protein [Arthrobacter zhaoguopingii]|uniref:DUF1232 domain-containing protein n=1 Tax=Arthrobacter zhaoguopingii TaxID=2681491 RepID=UPI00135CE48D|nr:DUF1232 domain-containing protein [Arthrobacter zhaoguopingii]
MDGTVVLGWLAVALGTYALLLLGLAAYARAHPETLTMTDALRFLPDLLRLLRRLAADRTVPAGVRVALLLLLAYLLLPIDLVPDFLPGIGYADDVLLVALVLRLTVRRAGAGAVERHWPGSPQGLAVLLRLAGL